MKEIMKIAITGGSGFIGGNLARLLAVAGHEVVIISRPGGESAAPPGASNFAVGLNNEADLAIALAGCDGVAHCAGINREIGSQTYEAVHVARTRNVVN